MSYGSGTPAPRLRYDRRGHSFDVLGGLEAPDGRLVPYEELVVRATLLYAMALRPELPPWRTSFGPKSAPIGTRTERPYPSYALYEMPLLAKMRLCHRSLLGAANVSPGLYPPLQELGERRDSVGLSWCGWP